MTDLGVPDSTERGRCGWCRHWTATDYDPRWGRCDHPLVLDGGRNDSAHRGVLASVLFTGDNFGCRHWHGNDCPTCGRAIKPCR